MGAEDEVRKGGMKGRDEGNSSSRSIWTESLKMLLRCRDFSQAVQSVGDTEEGSRFVGHHEIL